MPVILDATSWRLWLAEEPATPEDLKTMLVPYPAAGMTCRPVSKRVGNVKNKDPSLIKPI
jgi:putative SOS response-associated peptidase YedK